MAWNRFESTFPSIKEKLPKTGDIAKTSLILNIRYLKIHIELILLDTLPRDSYFKKMFPKHFARNQCFQNLHCLLNEVTWQRINNFSDIPFFSKERTNIKDLWAMSKSVLFKEITRLTILKLKKLPCFSCFLEFTRLTESINIVYFLMAIVECT